jgi:hypothetical protein
MVVQSRKAHRFSVALVVAFALSLVPGAAAQVIIKNPSRRPTRHFGCTAAGPTTSSHRSLRPFSAARLRRSW